MIMKMAPIMNLNGIAARTDAGIGPCHRDAIQLNTCMVLGIMIINVMNWKVR